MLKKVIKFKDFNGKDRGMEVYFNLNKPELVRLQTDYPGGLEAAINDFDPENKPQDILDMFEKIILMSYGRKSDDGLYFVKEEKEARLFMQSPAYEALFMELISDTDKAVDFINGVIGTSSSLSVVENNN